MNGDWRQQLQEAEQAHSEFDAGFLKRFDPHAEMPSNEAAPAAHGVGGVPNRQLQGPLSGLTQEAFERPQLDIAEGLAADAEQLVELLEQQEDDLMDVVDRTLHIRDQLIQAQAGSNSNIDLAELRGVAAAITTTAGHLQLQCTHIDVNTVAAHKNMALREWKSSLGSRYTKLQKVLVRLTKIATRLESASLEDRPMPFGEFIAKKKHNWSHQQVLQQKLQALHASANGAVCDSYVLEAQEQNLQVIQEVFGFLASPASQNYTLMLHSRTLTAPEMMIPLRLCATTATLYGNLNSLYLCDCHLADEHLSQLSTVLPELRNLQLVALRDNDITCAGTVELAPALRRCKELKRLWLDGNQIRARGAEALHQHNNLHGTVIEQVSLSRNPIGDAGLHFMMLALLNPLRKSYSALRSRPTSPSSTRHRRKSESTLTTITSVAQATVAGRRIRQVFIRLVAVHCFLSVRSRGRYTPVLQLEDMQLTSRGMEMIAHVLRENTSITALHLSKNSLQDEGAIALAAALPQATNLKSLDIAHNNIGERGIEALMLEADQSQSLQSLDLSGNEIAGAGLNWITSIGKSFYLDEVVLQGRQSRTRKQSVQPHEVQEQLMRFEQYQGTLNGSPMFTQAYVSQESYDLL